MEISGVFYRIAKMTQILTKATFDVSFVRIAWLSGSYEIQYQSRPFLFQGTIQEAKEVGEEIRHKFEVQHNCNGGGIFHGLTTEMNERDVPFGTYTYELGNDFYRIRLL